MTTEKIFFDHKKKKIFDHKKIFFDPKKFFFSFFFLLFKPHRHYGDIMPGFGTWAMPIEFMVYTFAVYLIIIIIIILYFQAILNTHIT